jgi:aspartate racemase
MAIVGLVGGLGPESTIDYYRRILQVWQEGDPSSAPGILIDSLDVQVGIRLAQSDHAGLTEYLFGSIERLARAGVDFIVMTANTAHLVFDGLAVRAPVPMLSIVEVCADEAQRLGVRRPLLLGTGFTMAAPFYPEVFGRRGIDVVVPSAEERAWLHERYIGELLKGDFRDETRTGAIALVDRLRRTSAVDAVILGGTELPLLLRADTIATLPTLDTTALHVNAIVNRLRRIGSGA